LNQPAQWTFELHTLLSSCQTFTIEANGATGGSILRGQRMIAFRTDAFASVEQIETPAESSTTLTTPQVKSVRTTSAIPNRNDYIVIQSLVLRGASATEARQAGFEWDDGVQTSYNHIVDGYYITSFGLFDALTTSSAIKYENTYSTSSGTFEVFAKESVIHVLCLPTW
jgi:hypothetical protein